MDAGFFQYNAVDSGTEYSSHFSAINLLNKKVKKYGKV